MTMVHTIFITALVYGFDRRCLSAVSEVFHRIVQSGKSGAADYYNQWSIANKT